MYIIVQTLKTTLTYYLKYIFFETPQKYTFCLFVGYINQHFSSTKHSFTVHLPTAQQHTNVTSVVNNKYLGTGLRYFFRKTTFHFI